MTSDLTRPAAVRRRDPTTWTGRARSAAIAVAAAAFLLGGCRGQAPADEGPVVTVGVAPVLNAGIQRTIRADAVIYPVQQAAIVPKISAPVKKVYVDRGARVRAGQLLVELDNADLAAAAQESEAAYQQAEAQYQTASRGTIPEDAQKAELDVRAAKDALDAAQAVYDNRRQLLAQGAIAQKEVNDAQVAVTQARNQYDTARKRLEDLQGGGHEASLKAAAAQRDAARARRDAAAAQLAYSKITSPIDGIVTDRPFYPGETPPAGAPVVTVMDLSQVVARAHVAQQEAAELTAGGDASVIAPDGSAVPGTVTQVSPALDPGSTTVEVWVRAPNPDLRLKAGASARVAIVAQTVPHALVIPESAVLTDSSGATSVITIASDQTPHRKAVTLGIHDAGKVQVTGGLASGERVATIGAFELGKLDDDVLARTKVKIQPPKKDEEP